MADALSTSNLVATMPPQKISYKKKTAKWGNSCVEALASFGTNRDANGRTTWEKKQSNYDLINGIINPDDVEYVMNPYGAEGSKKVLGNQPAQMRSINLVFNKISLMRGEEMQRPWNYMVTAVNGASVSEKQELKKQAIMDYISQDMEQITGEPQQLNNPLGEGNLPARGDLEKYMTFTYKDIREQMGSHILKYEEKEQNLKDKFNKGWFHGLAVAEEMYYIGIVNKKPVVRVCNPMNCDFDRNPDIERIQDGDWFKEERWMTGGQILDEYGKLLTDAQVKQIDSGEMYNRSGMRDRMLPGFAYTENDMDQYEKGNFGANGRFSNTHYMVTHVVWKSMKKIGFVSYFDENGEEQEMMVEEDFVITEEMEMEGYTVEWKWAPDLWHGTKIAEDMFVEVERLPNQYRSADDPFHVELPYVGSVYNAINSVQTSLVDLIKPHQYLYNIMFYRLEQEIAKAKGKKFIMDLAQIPRSEGFDLDKWMYFFDNVGIAFVNSFEEGKDKFQGQVSSFNQFNSVDMSLSQSVGQYIEIMTKIEQIIDKIVGITPQREGAIGNRETVGGVTQAVTQSSVITEPWFYVHNDIKKCVMTQLLECAKFAYPKSKKLNYIVNDIERVSMELDMDKFSESDYGIFVTDSPREHAMFQKLEGLAQQALSSGTAVLSDVIEMYKSSSISELSTLIKEAEDKRQQQEQQQMQQQQEMQNQQLQAQAQEKQAEREFIATENELDRQNKIDLAVISTAGFDTDTADNDQIDVVKLGDQAIKRSELDHKKAVEDSKLNVENRKMANERMKMDRESVERQKDRDHQMKVEKLKAKTALKNPVSGEKKKK